MTRTAVDNTVARLKAWIQAQGCYCKSMCAWTLDDLEDLRQHDEAQVAELDAKDARIKQLEAERVARNDAVRIALAAGGGR